MDAKRPTSGDERDAKKGPFAFDVALTALWLFLAALMTSAIWILIGINRAFASFAVQDSSKHPICDFFEAVIFAPSRLLPQGGNILPIGLTVVWVFLLCLLPSFLYHWGRFGVIRRVSPPKQPKT
jgi:hypothetical protein